MVSFTPQPLYSRGKSPQVPTRYEAGWAPEPVWTLWSTEKFAPTGNWTPAVQPVARPYTDLAIPAPSGSPKTRWSDHLFVNIGCSERRLIGHSFYRRNFLRKSCSTCRTAPRTEKSDKPAQWTPCTFYCFCLKSLLFKVWGWCIRSTFPITTLFINNKIIFDYT
jgi:hypothetical protein